MTHSDRELIRLWLLWKQAHEFVRTAVVADMTVRTALGEPELTVLVHLNAAGGTIRQNALALSTGWDRGRLSHVLTRVEKLRLASRTRLKNGVEITMQPAGQAIVDDTQPLLAAAVGTHLVDGLDDAQVADLTRTLATLVSRYTS